jgi:hypothetical protein
LQPAVQAKGKPCNLRRLQQARAAPTLLHANLPSRQASPHRGWGYIGANNIAAHAQRLAFCSRRYGAYGMALQPRQVAAPPHARHKPWGHIGANYIAARAPRLAFFAAGAMGYTVCPAAPAGSSALHAFRKPCRKPQRAGVATCAPRWPRQNAQYLGQLFAIFACFTVFFDILRLRCQKLPKTYNVLPPCARL